MKTGPFDPSAVQAVQQDAPDPEVPFVQAPLVKGPLVEVTDPKAGMLERAGRYLFDLQEADGHWCAELEGDSILGTEYILALCFLGRLNEPRAVKVANHVRSLQRADGGWDQYPGGPSDVSNSVKAYFALKLLGDKPTAPHMRRARQRIHSLGGVDATNSFTKLYLAIFGQYPWVKCPAVPPEMILFPHWFPFNIYEMSSWSRAIVVPLSVIWAVKPRCRVPEEAGLSELFDEPPAVPHRLEEPGRTEPKELRSQAWELFFRAAERSFTLADHLRLRPFRRRALATAERWILHHLEKSDGLGAIFPPIVNSILALRCLGYAQDDPLVQEQVRQLERFELEDKTTLRMQPCFSPVWDTALSINALLDVGVDRGHPRLIQAAEWLLEREVRSRGDWEIKNRSAEPGGWYFEYSNEFYPDCDDTAEVLTALSALEVPDTRLEARLAAARGRGVAWLLSMQNDDGGWASFDKGCDREFLMHVPFADHNAMIDPSTVDITGRVLRSLSANGVGRADAAVIRGIEFIRREQEPDGSWYGRWGCNYIYGTWLALSGLAATQGELIDDPAACRAVDWLFAKQNSDGGWGELPSSYVDAGLKGQGPSTAAQTAWAMLGLVAAGRRTHAAIGRGVDFLAERQLADGSWHDEYWTGTGFPKVFYLRYHLYATYFPMQALAAVAGRQAADHRPFPGPTEVTA